MTWIVQRVYNGQEFVLQGIKKMVKLFFKVTS